MSSPFTSSYLLNQIARKIQKGEIVVFIGAGASKNVHHQYPTGFELKGLLLQELPIIKSERKSLQDIALIYEKTYSRHQLEALVSSKVSDPKIKSSHLHQIISLLPVDIITTNYDTLIEDNYNEIFEAAGCNVIVDDPDIPGSKEGITIIKMHGSIGHDQTWRRLTITSDDYKRFLKEHKLIVSHLQTFFSKSILFLGYSLGDSDFREIYQEVRSYLDKFSPQSYVLMRPSARKSGHMKQGKGFHVIIGDLESILRILFRRVFFDDSTDSKFFSPRKLPRRDVLSSAVLHFLKEDQFSTGLWGKSIKQLFSKCFKSKVPDEYRSVGSFSATDMVIRDLKKIGMKRVWNENAILETMRNHRDEFGGVGIRANYDISKFSPGQLKIDANIRHTCAVVNIALMLGEYEDAFLSLKWLYQFKDFWVNPKDGKLPINLGCLIDCITHARINIGFSEFCYRNPKKFGYLRDAFLEWNDTKNSLYAQLNNALPLFERLWALKDDKGNILENTKTYIPLFIFLRLEEYAALYPKEFAAVIWALYNLRKGLGLPLSLRGDMDLGITGSYLKTVGNKKAEEVLKSELTRNNFSELKKWTDQSYKNLIIHIKKNPEKISGSFAEIISPILSLVQSKGIK